VLKGRKKIMPGNLSSGGPNSTGRKKSSHHLRAFSDLKCPSCGSNVYWGTHRCRRCGLDFPEELVSEIDKRSMMHYIPINYDGISRERDINNLLVYTITGLIILIILSSLTREVVVSDIKASYIISWIFFIVVLISVMMTVYYLTELRDLILNKTNLMFAVLLMAVVGLVTGFVAIIHVALYSGSEIELLACATFIILSAFVLAAGRPYWSYISTVQLQLVSIGTICITWASLRTLMYEEWFYSFFKIGGGPAITIIIMAVGITAIYAGAYYIFTNTELNIKMTISYPIWFAGISFMAVLTFSKSALFKKDLVFNYVETMLFSTGIVLISISLFLLLRKYSADRAISNHLNRSKATLALAENLYEKGKYSVSIKLYEKLLADNPCLIFGSNNSHPTLELLGIYYIYSRGNSKKHLLDGPPGKNEGLKKESLNDLKEPLDNDPVGDVYEDIEDEKADSKDGSAPESASEKSDGDTEEYSDGDDPEKSGNDGKEDPELISAEASALLKKSMFYEKAGMRQKALMAIERSIKLDRSRAEAWIRLGHLNSQIGGSWDRIKGYYDWVIDLKLHAIQKWTETETVPPRYSLWLLEELAVLKNNLRGMGRALRTMRTAGTRRPDIITSKRKR
jgi:tetratricopeptide (TPR) repeat protein